MAPKSDAALFVQTVNTPIRNGQSDKEKESKDISKNWFSK